MYLTPSDFCRQEHSKLCSALYFDSLCSAPCSSALARERVYIRYDGTHLIKYDSVKLGLKQDAQAPLLDSRNLFVARVVDDKVLHLTLVLSLSLLLFRERLCIVVYILICCGRVGCNHYHIAHSLANVNRLQSIRRTLTDVCLFHLADSWDKMHSFSRASFGGRLVWQDGRTFGSRIAVMNEYYKSYPFLHFCF